MAFDQYFADYRIYPFPQHKLTIKSIGDALIYHSLLPLYNWQDSSILIRIEISNLNMIPKTFIKDLMKKLFNNTSETMSSKFQIMDIFKKKPKIIFPLSYTFLLRIEDDNLLNNLGQVFIFFILAIIIGFLVLILIWLLKRYNKYQF